MSRDYYYENTYSYSFVYDRYLHLAYNLLLIILIIHLSCKIYIFMKSHEIEMITVMQKIWI